MASHQVSISINRSNFLRCGLWNTSVWHPIRGPCVDWPLAVCDAATVDFDKDTMASDFVDLWGYSENVQVHHSEAQRWYYLENQMPNELLVFKSADSEEGKPGVLPGTHFLYPVKSSANLLSRSSRVI